MQTKGKISVYQLFALLSVSRLLSTLTFVPSFPFEAGVSDYIVASQIGFDVLWAACIPVFVFLKKHEGNSLIQLAKNHPKALCAFYCVYLLFSDFFVLLRLRQFVSSVFFNSVNSAFFTVLTVIAVCYCASFSLEALARAGSISLVLLLVSLSIVFISLSDSLDINNLSPVFYYGASPVVKMALGVAARSTEPVIILLTADRVTGNIRKGLALWLTAITVLITACGLFLMLSLSDSALLQAFPFHAMAQLSRSGVIERMDAIISGIWIMSAFLKSALFTLLIRDLLSEQFKFRQRYFLFCFAVITCAALLLSERSALTTATLSSVSIREILFAVFTLTVPITLLISNKIKRKNAV